MPAQAKYSTLLFPQKKEVSGFSSQYLLYSHYSARKKLCFTSRQTCRNAGGKYRAEFPTPPPPNTGALKFFNLLLSASGSACQTHYKFVHASSEQLNSKFAQHKIPSAGIIFHLEGFQRVSLAEKVRAAPPMLCTCRNIWVRHRHHFQKRRSEWRRGKVN
jgi:hypothetical protein